MINNRVEIEHHHHLESKYERGGMWLDKTSDIVYIMARAEKGDRLISLVSGNVYSSDSIFDEFEENFERIPTGSQILITLKEV